jgi:hypothetical protein
MTRGRRPLAPQERARRALERARRGREAAERIAAEMEKSRRAGQSVTRMAALERVAVKMGRSKRTLHRDLAAYRKAAAAECKREQSGPRPEYSPLRNSPAPSITDLTTILRDLLPPQERPFARLGALTLPLASPFTALRDLLDARAPLNNLVSKLKR